MYFNIYEHPTGGRVLGGPYKNTEERDLYGVVSEQEPDRVRWTHKVDFNLESLTFSVREVSK